VTHHPYDVGTSLLLVLPEIAPSVPKALAVKIVNVLRYTDNSWFIGGEFRTPLNDRQFTLLVRRWN
jgi:hypothetical protein